MNRAYKPIQLGAKKHTRIINENSQDLVEATLA